MRLFRFLFRVLQERPQATLTSEEARKISICVVDVNRPDA